MFLSPSESFQQGNSSSHTTEKSKIIFIGTIQISKNSSFKMKLTSDADFFNRPPEDDGRCFGASLFAGLAEPGLAEVAPGPYVVS